MSNIRRNELINQQEAEEEDNSTSSVDSSDDDDEDYIDVENGEIDKSWTRGEIDESWVKETKSKKSTGTVKYPRSKKTHHNASERQRREQLKACFSKLKHSMKLPEMSNNEALKHVATMIDNLEDEKRRLSKKIKQARME